jgi:YVTN family beta-propeller protein
MSKSIPGLGVLGLALVLTTVGGADQKETMQKLYVTNSAGDNIHVVDLGSFKVIGEIRTGEHPHGAAVTADGRRFFTTVEGDHTLRVTDTVSDQIIQSWASGSRPVFTSFASSSESSTMNFVPLGPLSIWVRISGSSFGEKGMQRPGDSIDGLVVRIARPWRFASEVGLRGSNDGRVTQLLMPVYHEQEFHCIPDEQRATYPAVLARDAMRFQRSSRPVVRDERPSLDYQLHRVTYPSTAIFESAADGTTGNGVGRQR